MKLPTADAARKLGLTVPAFLDAAARLVAELPEAWPEIDDGYVETMQQLYRLGPPADQQGITTRAAAPRPTDDVVPPPMSQVDRAKLRILDKLERSDRWGGNAVSFDTLRNHYCQGIDGFEEGLEQLIDADLVIVGERGSKRKGPFSLNPAMKGAIQKELTVVRKSGREAGAAAQQPVPADGAARRR